MSYPPGRDYWQEEERDIPVTTGNITSVQSTVEGVNGCVAGAKLDNCIMILPVVDNFGPGGTGSNASMALRMVQAFYIRELNNGTHSGALVKDYFVRADSGAFFIPGSHAPKVLRLIK